MSTMERIDPYAAARRAGNEARRGVSKKQTALEAQAHAAQERARRAQIKSQQERWAQEEVVYKGLIDRRNALVETKPLPVIEVEAREDALAYVDIAKKLEMIPTKRPLSQDALAEIATKELKKSFTGVVRKGHAYVVMPEAVEVFVNTYRSTEKALRKEMRRGAARRDHSRDVGSFSMGMG